MMLAENIKMMRYSMGKTQKQIANDIGLEQGMYANWETGRKMPSAENLVKLADYFRCSIDYLLNRELEDGRKTYDDYQVKSKKSEIQSIYDELDEVKQRMAIGYVKRLRDIEFDEKQITSGSHRTKRA